VKKLLLFASSLLSFVDNQHLGMKKDFSQNLRGAKDRVILRIISMTNQSV
jgi:hypothetical protein